MIPRNNLHLATHAAFTTRRQMITACLVGCGSLAFYSSEVLAEEDLGITRTSEAIHQEAMFKAPAKKVYEALTDTAQFDKVVQLSGALQSMKLGHKPTEISPDVGGAFTLFGGHITGRHVELIPNQRLVQAWRTESWAVGAYSIARFDLVELGSECKIIFDHTGFPKGEAESLATGWKSHYWAPLQKLFS
jgi:activator of HSP90 ATPase